MNDKKLKYLSKTIKFGSTSMTLFSLDGFTWSSRKNELVEIKERHDRERITMADIKGESSVEEEKPAEEGEAETEVGVDDQKPPRKMAKVTKIITAKKGQDKKASNSKPIKAVKSNRPTTTMKSNHKAAAKSKLKKRAA